MPHRIISKKLFSKRNEQHYCWSRCIYAFIIVLLILYGAFYQATVRKLIAEAFLFQKAAPTPALPDIMMDYRFTAKPAPKSFPSVKMEPKKLALSNNNLKPVTQSPSRVIEPSKTIKKSVEVSTYVDFKWLESSPMPFPTAFPSRNLVIGIAFQIDDKHLSIFASSLRANSDAVCILFVDSSPSGRQKELLERNRIYSIQVDLHALRPSALHKYHASSLRWILFDRLLHATVRSEGGHLLINRRAIEERLYATSSHPSQRLFNQNFDRILTLDVRDSVFQSDPFSAMPALSLSNGQLIGEIIHLQGLPQPIVARLYTLLVFGEDEYVSIGMCGWNSGWVRDVFSEGVLSAIGSCPVICSGVSMGFNHAMVVYIHYMSLAMRGQRLPQFSREDEQDEWEELTQGENATITARKPIVATTQSGSAPRLSKYRYLSSAAVRKRIDNFREENRNAHLRPIGRSNEDVLEEINRQNQLPKTERNGVDQGVHNVLIYSNIIPALILYPANFPVINLQSALELRPFVIDRSAGGMLLAQQSRNPYVVVHQYDRLPDFQSILMERYVPWVNINDPMSEWRESSHCAPFSHSKDVDLLRGQCDAGSQRVMTLASCCEVCNRRAGRTTEDLGRSPADLYTKSPLAGATACTGFAYVGGVCFFKNCGVEGVKNALSHVALGNAMAGFLREPGAVSGYLTP